MSLFGLLKLNLTVHEDNRTVCEVQVAREEEYEGSAQMNALAMADVKAR